MEVQGWCTGRGTGRCARQGEVSEARGEPPGWPPCLSCPKPCCSCPKPCLSCPKPCLSLARAAHLLGQL
eukprot:6786361-Prymnesium_polylepis.1